MSLPEAERALNAGSLFPNVLPGADPFPDEIGSDDRRESGEVHYDGQRKQDLEVGGKIGPRAQDMAVAAYVTRVGMDRLDIEKDDDEERQSEHSQIGLPETPFLLVVDIMPSGQQIAVPTAEISVDHSGRPAADPFQRRNSEG
jgi:hypothetical protein